MVSTSKKKIFRSTYLGDKSVLMLGSAMALSLMVGCASQPKTNEAPASQASVAESTQSESTQSDGAAQASNETSAVETAKTETMAASKENADQLMASLKAPLQEPVAAKSEGAKKKEPAKAQVEAVEKNVEKTEAKAEVQAEEALAQSVQKDKADRKAPTSPKPTITKTQEKPLAKTEKQVMEKAEGVMVENAKTVQKTASTKPLAVSKKDLPFSYDIWVIKQGETPLTKGLVISTPTWEMGKGSYMSQIWLTLKEDALLVNSSSDIATEVKNIGISIDGGKLIPFTRIAENNIGVVEGDWLDKLASANKLDIYLGFFPGKKPVSERFNSNTSLENLDRIVATYKRLK